MFSLLILCNYPALSIVYLWSCNFFFLSLLLSFHFLPFTLLDIFPNYIPFLTPFKTILTVFANLRETLNNKILERQVTKHWLLYHSQKLFIFILFLFFFYFQFNNRFFVLFVLFCFVSFQFVWFYFIFIIITILLDFFLTPFHIPKTLLWSINH